MDKVNYYYNNFHLLGIQEMETLLSSPISLVKSDKISLKTASKLLSFGPSKVLGLNTGRISKGSPADFTIIDIEKSWIVKGIICYLSHQIHFLRACPCKEKFYLVGKME